jgi:hypothetical protein
MAASNIGMMDGAYFVGRNEILAWINTTLQLGLSKVEEVSSARISPPAPDLGEGVLASVWSLFLSDLRGGRSVRRVGGGGLCARRVPGRLTPVADLVFVCRRRRALLRAS